MKYRKIPVVVEAFQVTKKSVSDRTLWPEWFIKARELYPMHDGAVSDAPYHLESHPFIIKTKDGHYYVSFNDWIIRDVNGEIYPCKPEIFEATYEQV